MIASNLADGLISSDLSPEVAFPLEDTTSLFGPWTVSSSPLVIWQDSLWTFGYVGILASLS